MTFDAETDGLACTRRWHNHTHIGTILKSVHLNSPTIYNLSYLDRVLIDGARNTTRTLRRRSMCAQLQWRLPQLTVRWCLNASTIRFDQILAGQKILIWPFKSYRKSFACSQISLEPTEVKKRTKKRKWATNQNLSKIPHSFYLIEIFALQSPALNVHYYWVIGVSLYQYKNYTSENIT